MVYIVVLNWNGWKDTISCIESLMDLNFHSYKIIVCDNNSSDNSIEEIKSWYYKNKNTYSYLKDSELKFFEDSKELNYSSPVNRAIYLIQTGSNLGFSGGNNVGIKFALKQPDLEYIWLLNNDTEVEALALSFMVERMNQDSKIGLCGSKLIYDHDRRVIQGIGGIYNPWLCTSKHYKEGEPKDIELDQTECESVIDYVIGASMLIKKEVFLNVGLLSEDYFLYYEELDYTFRLRRAGYKIGLALNSVVYHKEGASTKKSKGVVSDFYFVKNKLTLTKKFNIKYLPVVYSSLILVSLNRLRRFEFFKFINVIRIMFGSKKA